MKNIIKSMILTLAIGILTAIPTHAATNNYDNNLQDVYTVEVQSIDKINNTITLNKDGQLYNFKFCTDVPEEYYLGEKVNALIYNNKIIDFFVIDQPTTGQGTITKITDSYLTVSINGSNYTIENDIGANWSIGDKVNTVVQDNKLLEISPYK